MFKPEKPLRWGERHFEQKVNAVWDDTHPDFGISLSTSDVDGYVSIRADQLHDAGINMSAKQVRRLAIELLRAADAAGKGV